MNRGRGQQSGPMLDKLVQLYEMRQEKARKAFQEQQKQFLHAKEKLSKRQHEFDAVNQEKVALQKIENAEEHASNLRIQQYISVKRRWLKYDFDKAQYFLNDAQSDFDTEQKEANELRSNWMQLRAKVEKFKDQSLLMSKREALLHEAMEESDLEEELMIRSVVAQTSSRRGGFNKVHAQPKSEV